MKSQKVENRQEWMVRSVAVFLLVSALSALAACVAAIPAAVVYYEDEHRYTATADVEGADDVPQIGDAGETPYAAV